MKRLRWFGLLGLGGLLTLAPGAMGQSGPYIGFVYPAGGQQGMTVPIRLGGQRIDAVYDVIVSGEGVKGRIVEYHRKLSNQEMSLLREQLRDLKPRRRRSSSPPPDATTKKLIANLEARISGWVNRPACGSLSALAYAEITIAADAEPGEREIRLVTARGLSNPMVFHVGQLPETTRKPMKTAAMQVLGKEELALRKRPDDEVEVRVEVPCVMNGQIASGEVNRYRFAAKKGQSLVVSVNARQLIPYIADAVPGWFQPELTLFDGVGKELAFNDDFRFKPDPTLYFKVPADGEYVLAIADAIHRGREDFVYRITLGETPFVTGVYPLGRRAGSPSAKLELSGWNLENARTIAPKADAGPGAHAVVAKVGKAVSNPAPFELDSLPEGFDKESNDDAAHAQKVKLPLIVNGRIDRPDDRDVFEFVAKAGDVVVAEVSARRLDSPVDSRLTLTDAAGNVLAFNDDFEDPGSGVNTHHADSYLRVKLPAAGIYRVHLADTARQGGEAYAYRLRLSAPRPDFELRVVPSSVNFRSKGSAAVMVYAIRKDGFNGPIVVDLKDAPAGFQSRPTVLKEGQEKVKFGIRTILRGTPEPVDLTIAGTAKIRETPVRHDAVPSEDRMQAFLWRHLVPAQSFKALVYNAAFQPEPDRPAPTIDLASAPAVAAKGPAKSAGKAKFGKKQVASRLRQLKALYQEWLLSDSFYRKKVEECATVN